MKILIVEDDVSLCGAIKAQLEFEGYDVESCHDGEDGLYYTSQNAYDLILLDRMLPKMDGISVLHEIRKSGINTPVMLITALGDVNDRVDGLDAGADDYLVKPFANRELSARVRALLRRPEKLGEDNIITFKDLRLDLNSQCLCGKYGSTELSKKEAQLLTLFFNNPNRTLTRELLFMRVWGPDTEVETANLDNYIHFIRRRVRAVTDEVAIVTVRGTGYKLEEKTC